MISPIKTILFPLFLWLVFIPWSGEIDLKISHYFYQNETFDHRPFWKSFYDFGFWPAWFIFISALIGLTLSFIPSYKSIRKGCLVLILTFAVGSGIIVHGVLKEHWGRPRPRQLTEFGGTESFRPFYSPHFGSKSLKVKSFPSGHASTGFYLLTLALLGAAYRNRLLYWTGLSLGLTFGVLLSLARIAQGGHFLSDTLASGFIMWTTGWCFTYIFLFKQIKNTNPSSKINERIDIQAT